MLDLVAKLSGHSRAYVSCGEALVSRQTMIGLRLIQYRKMDSNPVTTGKVKLKLVMFTFAFLHICKPCTGTDFIYSC